MNTIASLSVIIPTWQRLQTLAKTLEAIAHENIEFEVIVVCDGEDAATRQLSQNLQDPHIKWIFHKENLGLPAARNTGAAHSTGEILLFLDDDMEIEPGLLSLHVDAHKGCSKLAVQGRIVERAQSPQQSKTGAFLEQAWMRTLERSAETAWSNDKLAIPADAVTTTWFGTNCSIRRKLFQDSSGFNTSLRASDEEMEFGLRLYMAGVRFEFEPQAIAYHHNSKDFVSYIRSCWSASGHLHVSRAMRQGERNAQTRQLIGMHTGPHLLRLANSAIWHCNGIARAVATALQQITEATGSRISFRLWHDISLAQQYWGAVRDEGVTPGELRELAGNPTRALLLHSVYAPQNAAESSYYLSPARFRRLLMALRAGNYRSVEPERLLSPGFGTKDFVLTFDDGYDDFYTEVFPLCGEYGLKPLVFLPAARIGQSNLWDQSHGLRARNLVTIGQVREMQKYGVRFGSHTLTHPSLPMLSDSRLKSELVDSKKLLEDLLGAEVSTVAYPCGEVNRRVRAAVIEAGYKLAFSTKTGLGRWEDPFDIPRTEFNETDAVSLYPFKLATGLKLREAIKYELSPLLHMIPGSLRRKLRILREKFRTM